MTRHHARRRVLGPVLLVLGFVLAVASCADDGGGDGSSSVPLAESAATSSGSRASATGATGAAGTGAAGSAATGATGATQPAASTVGIAVALTPGNDVVYTGTLDVRVDDVDAAARDAQRRVAALGGYLFSQRSAAANGAPSATLIFKLPPVSFVGAVDALASLGDEVSRNLQADDVSAQVVDLESRLRTAQASLERTRGLLERASGMNDIVTLEREVAARETTVEQLQGQLRVIRAQVAAATLTVTIGEKPEDDPAPAAEPGRDLPGVLDGLKAGADALLVTLRVIGLVLATALPWVVPAAALWWVGRRVVRFASTRAARRAVRADAGGPGA